MHGTQEKKASEDWEENGRKGQREEGKEGEEQKDTEERRSKRRSEGGKPEAYTCTLGLCMAEAGGQGRQGRVTTDRAWAYPKSPAPPRHHTGHTGAGASPGPESQRIFILKYK